MLDKAAATKDELLSCLPYGPMPPALVADGVRFTFVEPALLSVRGRDEYTRLLSHWRTMMPERLLSSKARA